LRHIHYKLYALTNRTQMIPSLRNTGKEESRKTRLLLFLFFENNNTVLCSFIHLFFFGFRVTLPLACSCGSSSSSGFWERSKTHPNPKGIPRNLCSSSPGPLFEDSTLLQVASPLPVPYWPCRHLCRKEFGSRCVCLPAENGVCISSFIIFTALHCLFYLH